MFYIGSRKSNSGTSSRAGSGLSVMSDHRPSSDRRPVADRNDHQGTLEIY